MKDFSNVSSAGGLSSMKKFEGTRSRVPILCLFIVITLIWSVGAMAQAYPYVYDKVLVNSSNVKTASPTSVNCALYASDGVTCVKGQYYRSDGGRYNPTYNATWQATSDVTFTGNITAGSTLLTITSGTTPTVVQIGPGESLTGNQLTTGLGSSAKILSVNGNVATMSVAATATVNGEEFGFTPANDTTVPYTGIMNWAEGGALAAGLGSIENPCLGCHHSIKNDTSELTVQTGTGMGPNYLITGHKNILRKVIPGSVTGGGAWADYTGTEAVYATLPSPNPYNWSTGTYNGTEIYYLLGLTNAPTAELQGASYGQCARCHTTGYRFDALGPEPTDYTALNPITDAQLLRVPAGAANCTVGPTSGAGAYTTPAACQGAGGNWSTSSWSLTGVQCERCHNVDMQTNATGNAVGNSILFNGTGTSGGRVGHEGPSGGTGALNVSFPISGASVNGSNLFIKTGSTATALCIECHRQDVATVPTAAGSFPDATGKLNAVQYNLGSIHPTQLPNSIGTLPTTTPIPGVSASINLAPVKDGGKCSDGSSKKYTACLAVPNNYWAFAPSMSHGSTGAEAFLNSPHGLFTGYFDQTAQNSPDLSVTFTGSYNSFFSGYAEAPGTQGTYNVAGDNGGCAGCHDVHNSVLPRNKTTQAQNASGFAPGSVMNATNVAPAIVQQCTTCHTNNHYAPGKIAHSQGPGTPFANVNPNDPSTASDSCVVCHTAAAGGAATYHYFRINPSATYYTFGPAAALYASSDTPTSPFQPNTYAEADSNPVTYAPITYPAVGLDVDIACGQCHGGGTQSIDANGVQHRVPTYSNVQAGQAPYFDRQTLSTFATNIHNTQVTVAQPVTFSQNQGTFKAGTSLSVTMKTMTTTAQICYTTDGSIPALTDTTSGDSAANVVCSSTVNGVTVSPATAMTGTNGIAGPVTVTANTVIKAIAGGATTAGAAMTNSAVAVANYTILAAPTVAPTISIAGTIGSNGYYPASSVVTLTSTAATVYYTTNGQDPRISTTRISGTTLTLTPAKPAAITIKAVAKGSDGSYSPVSSVVYLVQ
jgi:hypothetical protein